jgi:Flp pilus assembly protein TadB
VSKQRTQRRVQRQVEQQRQERATKERRAARSQQRRQGRRQTKSVRGRTGWAGMRRSRRQKIGIAAVAVVGIAVIWLFAEWQLAIALSVLLLLTLPAFVVLTMGRRY